MADELKQNQLQKSLSSEDSQKIGTQILSLLSGMQVSDATEILTDLLKEIGQYSHITFGLKGQINKA